MSASQRESRSLDTHEARIPSGAQAPQQTTFDRDTAVHRRDGGHENGTVFDAEVSPDWFAVTGPHGGYLAAMLLRALTETVGDRERSPRSLTVHYARPASVGPVTIHTVAERTGRSLSTLTARMEQSDSLIALGIAAFSVPWQAADIAESPMPEVAPSDPSRERKRLLDMPAPPVIRQLVIQPRIGAVPFTASEAPMEVGAWLGFTEPRPVDALALALFSDALFSPPFIRFERMAVTPTIDLTIHFRQHLPREENPDPGELCFGLFHSTLVHEGFFEEDGVIWGSDGTVLAQSRQLGAVIEQRD